MTNFEQSMAEARTTSVQIGIGEDETLLDYLDRLTLLADRREACERQAYQDYLEALECRAADEQLARYRAMIMADLARPVPSLAEVPAACTPQVVLVEPAPSGEAEAAPQEPDTTPVDSELNSEPELKPADPADDEENQKEPVSDRDRLLAWVTTLDGNEFAAADAADELELTKSSSEAHLRDMLRGGLVTRVPGTGRPGVPSRYVQAGAAPETSRPPAPQPQAGRSADPVRPPTHIQEGLPPMPTGLNLDERSTFDCLRHETLGLTGRVVAARLNWPQGRADRILGRLLEQGHIGRCGERYVAIPEDLVAGVAS